jgi:hypothetical protein
LAFFFLTTTYTYTYTHTHIPAVSWTLSKVERVVVVVALAGKRRKEEHTDRR